MTPTNLTNAKTKQGNDHEFEIRFIPLPPEHRASWDLAMKLMNEIILSVVKEPLHGINKTESEKNILADSNTSRFDFDEKTL